jgi:hypothetical protein
VVVSAQASASDAS